MTAMFHRRNLPKNGLRTLRNEIVPPRCQKVVNVAIQSKGPIQTVPFETESPVMIANTVSDVCDNTTEIVVCNPTQETITIREDTQVSNFEPFEDNPAIAETDDSTITTNEPAKLVNFAHTLEDETTTVIANDLNLDQRSELIGLLNKHKPAFSINGELGLTHVAEHHIELLPNTKPHAEPLRRRPYADVEECRNQIRDLLSNDIIEESDSPWAAAYLLTKKKTGGKRLCIDLRKLNEATKKVVYPLPHIDDCIETLSGKRYFSSLDMASGFWQIPMAPESRELTAFRTEDGLFQFKRMPFGLTNAPASFQKMANAIFAGLKGVNLQVFIDDICVATNTWEEHLSSLNQVFWAVRKANLKLKAEKCIFGASRIIFLGHEISEHGIRQDPSKLAAIAKLPAPTDREGVRRFLGMSGYYRRFVPGFSIIAAPLIELTRSKTVFRWTGTEAKSFANVIRALLENATLAHFNHADPLMLKTDACKDGIAGILLQQHNGDWKIVTCCSRRLNSSEQNYGITDLEGLALVYSVQKLRNYLLGKHFEILVDHCALCVLNKKTPQSSRLRRWQIILSEFTFTIKYTKGTLHRDADCLSRSAIDDGTDSFLDHKIYMVRLSNDTANWSNEYNDSESAEILGKARDGFDGWRIVNGTIYSGQRLYVPPSKRKELLKEAHDSITGGHGGSRVTLNKLRHFKWPKMEQDVAEHIAACISCQQRKIPRQKPSGTMHHFEGREPLELVAIDAWNTSKGSRKNNTYVLTAVDHFTKYIYTKALSELTGATCAVFVSEFVSCFGVPKTILTDNAATFTSIIFKDTLAAYRITQRFATPGHSQSNSVVERAIQTLQDRLASATLDPDNQSDWDDLLPAITYSINTSLHSTTNFTPYELMFGREAPLRSDHATNSSEPRDLYARLIKSHLSSAHKLARINTQRRLEDSEERYAATHTDREFAIGDKVMARNAGKRDDTKTGVRFVGPYEIEAKEDDIYDLKHCRNKTRTRRHASSLKPFVAAMLLTIFIRLTLAQFDEQAPILYIGTEYAVEEQRHFIDLAVGIDCPCFKITMKPYAYVPKHLFKAGDKRECDAVGCYQASVEVSSHVSGTYGCWLYKTSNAIAEEIGIRTTPRQCAYDTELILTVHNMYTTCLARWTSLLAVIENFDAAQSSQESIYNEEERRAKRSSSNASDTVTEAEKMLESITFRDPDDPNTERIVTNKLISEAVEKHNPYIDSKNSFRLWQKFYGSRPSNNSTRPKRDATQFAATIVKDVVVTSLKEALSAFAMGIGANVVTDLFRFSYEYVNPNSNTNRLTRMEKQLNTVIRQVQLHEEILHKLINTTEDLSLKIAFQDLLRIVDKTNDRMVSVISSELFKTIDRAENAFKKLTTSKLKGRIDADAIATLTDNNEWLMFDDRYSEMRRSKVKTNERERMITVIMPFNVHYISRDTFVAKIFAFDHWDLTPEIPTLMRYDGKEYLIFNQTSHCAKAIDKPAAHTVFANCDVNGYIDSELTRWDKVKTAADPRSVPAKSVIHPTSRFTYIYCFPNSITINGETIPCPNAAFRLPIMQSFKLPDHPEWKPSYRTLQAHLKPGDVLDYVHSNQFNTYSTQDLSVNTVHQIIEMRKQLNEQREQLKVVEIQKQGFFHWLGLTIVIVVLTILFVTCCVCCIRKEIWSRLGLILSAIPKKKERKQTARRANLNRGDESKTTTLRSVGPPEYVQDEIEMLNVARLPSAPIASTSGAQRAMSPTRPNLQMLQLMRQRIEDVIEAEAQPR